jgi:hypothetical protein
MVPHVLIVIPVILLILIILVLYVIPLYHIVLTVPLMVQFAMIVKMLHMPYKMILVIIVLFKFLIVFLVTQLVNVTYAI